MGTSKIHFRTAADTSSGSDATRPLIVAMGGTSRVGSTSERVLRIAAKRVSEAGARVEVFGATELNLPMYVPERSARTEEAEAIVSAMRRAHGFIVASPSYHGTMTGLIKNVLDYAEDLNKDTPCYWEGRAVGLIACAAGWQAGGSTLMALRSVVHALRGWPTPMGVALNTVQNAFSPDGAIADESVDRQLSTLVQQVLSFATMRMIAKSVRLDA